MCNSGDFVCGGNGVDLLPDPHADYSASDLRTLAQFAAAATLADLSPLPRCGLLDERPTQIVSFMTRQ